MNGTISAVMRAIIDRVYPVGIIVDFAVEMDPNTAVGCGTQWQRIADGRTLIASDGSHPVGWSGGEATHKLTASEVPSHKHTLPKVIGWPVVQSTGEDWSAVYSNNTSPWSSWIDSTSSHGGNGAHNNMQPSLAVARWKRVA